MKDAEGNPANPEGYRESVDPNGWEKRISPPVFLPDGKEGIRRRRIINGALYRFEWLPGNDLFTPAVYAERFDPTCNVWVEVHRWCAHR